MNEEIINFEHDNLSDQEKEEAKQNGIILTGKTGNGKTTLINAMFNKIVGKAEKSAESVTKECKVYYYKLTNGKVVALIDTPGLGDSNKPFEKKNIDEKHLQEISKIVSEERIHIKGILFFVNFQKSRFDSDETEALLNYNRIFPLKNFWKNIVIIYSHFFVDPNEDDDEEIMIKKRSESDGNIFKKIMDKVNEVSDIISYEELKKKYFNSYSEANNEKKRKNNNKNRKELEIILDELIKSEALFHTVEINHINNYKWKGEDGKEYIGEVEIIRFFDFNKEPIKERMNIINKEEVKKQENYPPSSGSSSYYGGGFSDSGHIIYQPIPPPPVTPVTYNDPAPSIALLLTGVGLIAASAPSAPIALGVTVLSLGVGALFGKLLS